MRNVSTTWFKFFHFGLESVVPLFYQISCLFLVSQMLFWAQSFSLVWPDSTNDVSSAASFFNCSPFHARCGGVWYLLNISVCTICEHIFIVCGQPKCVFRCVLGFFLQLWDYKHCCNQLYVLERGSISIHITGLFRVCLIVWALVWIFWCWL